MKITTIFFRPVWVTFFTAFLLLNGFSVRAQDTIKVCEYNLLQYGVTGFGCIALSTKDPYLTNIMTEIRPDLLGVNELGSNSIYADRILTQILQPINPAYARANLTNNAGSDITNMLFYNSDVLGLKYQKVINHSLRDLNFYNLYYKAADLATNTDTVFINVVVAHLKAGSDPSDATTRANQTQTIMAYLNALGLDDNLIILGDFNLQTSSETAFQNMVNHSNTKIKMYDPVNSPGNWNYNSVFACLHTQSTMDSPIGCGSGGGLDDRFDFILINDAVKSNTYDLQYINGSFHPFGNDCQHFNKAINNPTNTAVSSTVANSLKAFSDHLPTVMELKVAREPAVGIGEPRAFLKGIGVDILGNPLENELRFRIRNLGAETAALRLWVTDLNGRTLLGEQLNAPAGSSQYAYAAGPWASGMYLLRIEDSKGNFAVKKLIKR
ncbi:MAG: T9SS type A sorting domain-containing protein [Bacteroidia bacterium]|nr:T9SS type A sorting domain-containing protein [Bacteroidia bacterium]